MIKVGIFFGGPSREREISFAGGRTVFDNLDKTLFEPVPIFVDSLGGLIELDWSFIYKGTIRDFFPPVQYLPETAHQFQVYLESLNQLSDAELKELRNSVGQTRSWDEIAQRIDFAFLALHGEFGEDGQIQGILEALEIPYSGSGIRACAIGIDKAFQKKMMEAGGFECPNVIEVKRAQWIEGDQTALFEEAKAVIQYPIVIRPAKQGSSIGVSILQESSAYDGFIQAMDLAFFRQRIKRAEWNKKTADAQVEYVRNMADIRDGLGFPMDIQGQTVYHPEELLNIINEAFKNGADELLMEAWSNEQKVIIESFIDGKEFSCIVVRKEDGSSEALPPTEIVKGGELFDYRSKYMPGRSRKLTPIDLPNHQDIRNIMQECVRLFEYLQFHTYARIDGFITADGKIFLNDPNTTSGMLPSSFFFHQAAEIGLNPSQFLTFIIRVSLYERIGDSVRKNKAQKLYRQLVGQMNALQNQSADKTKVGVFLGGYSFERHISVESGRNIYEKLSSSAKYTPVPIFLMKSDDGHKLYQIPINLLLKDNADDIRDKILKSEHHPVIDEIKDRLKDMTETYAGKEAIFHAEEVSYTQLQDQVDAVFIALHGRPGEDGEVQRKLDEIGIPYNGCSADASSITINKYNTLQKLKAHGFTVTDQSILEKLDYLADPKSAVAALESDFDYPFIAKPVDDGCSSAVKVIKNQAQLDAFIKLMFRAEESVGQAYRMVLDLDEKEEFPIKDQILFEKLIQRAGAKHFLEITGGFLTRVENGQTVYEMFEPSEALATGEVLSLQEKFLAGEGQNITPARYSKNPDEYSYIAQQVKGTLQKAAEVLDVRGYARIDAFVRVFEDNTAETIIIEVNSLPGMTPATCIFHQAAINGYKPYNFIDKILEYGFNARANQTLVD